MREQSNPSADNVFAVLVGLVLLVLAVWQLGDLVGLWRWLGGAC